ncbi:uncharacterized protein B0I36DRAFT_352530 [Microdochium trichocladiopsis]|uniref:Small secreted protein n=1 Tax=Microdochium trichocladiopsis TaxID=1682393 RepID=A0A9P8XZQ6_9PEZI|nr:uncharacterized protein B0I36DRAFT_352530 [Microdochium trichocladiopsis]KAH7026700.1 hypothetical protein B0I36DRAFT_352530 [Microdochium trichocladiopsis]
MYFRATFLATVLAATSVLGAAIDPSKIGSSSLSRRQQFQQKTYNEISISGGTAGNAEAEAEAVFASLNLNDLANASEDDKDFLNSVNKICNQAEKGAFNPAIAAASGAEAAALQAGKIKNKVLKLKATLLLLSIKEAQGEDVAADIAAETKKFNNNIKQDQDAAGDPSTFLPFDASTKGGI